MLKYSLTFCVLCTLVACDTPEPKKQGYGFGPPNTTLTSSGSYKAPAVAPVRTTGAARTLLPSYSETSRKFRRTGKPVSIRVAADRSAGAGGAFFTKAQGKTVQIGKYKVDLRHARYDNHDFVVSVIRSGIGIVGSRRHIDRTIRPQIETLSGCSLTDNGYWALQGEWQPTFVYNVSC